MWRVTAKGKGRKPIQDQSSVLGADILNICRNNYQGGSFKRFTWFRLSPRYQLGEFGCSWEVQLCNSISLVDHVCKLWPNQKNMWCLLSFLMFKDRICRGGQFLSRCLGDGIFPGRGWSEIFWVSCLFHFFYMTNKGL